MHSQYSQRLRIYASPWGGPCQWRRLVELLSMIHLNFGAWANPNPECAMTVQFHKCIHTHSHVSQNREPPHVCVGVPTRAGVPCIHSAAPACRMCESVSRSPAGTERWGQVPGAAAGRSSAVDLAAPSLISMLRDSWSRKEPG